MGVAFFDSISHPCLYVCRRNYSCTRTPIKSQGPIWGVWLQRPSPRCSVSRPVADANRAKSRGWGEELIPRTGFAQALRPPSYRWPACGPRKMKNGAHFPRIRAKIRVSLHNDGLQRRVSADGGKPYALVRPPPARLAQQ